MVVTLRHVGEEIVIGDNILVSVLAVDGDTVRLGVRARGSACVRREEPFAEGHSPLQVATVCKLNQGTREQWP
jgi:carbon storage regulator